MGERERGNVAARCAPLPSIDGLESCERGTSSGARSIPKGRGLAEGDGDVPEPQRSAAAVIVRTGKPAQQGFRPAAPGAGCSITAADHHGGQSESWSDSSGFRNSDTASTALGANYEIRERLDSDRSWSMQHWMRWRQAMQPPPAPQDSLTSRGDSAPRSMTQSRTVDAVTPRQWQRTASGWAMWGDMAITCT